MSDYRMALIRRVPVLACLTLLIVAAGCSRQTDAPAANGQPGHGPGRGPGQGAAEAAVPVAVQTVATGDIASYYNATATLEAEKQAPVLARVSGMVEALLAEEGDEVAEGDPLLRIETREYDLRLQQAVATTANLKARFDRLAAMRAEELATQEEFETARSDLANAEAEEGLARLTLSYTTMRAPFAGRVTERLADVGQNLSVGAQCFTLADFHPLLARVHVPSREFNRLQGNQAVDLVLDSNDTRLTGTIKLISPIIDPASGTIKITVEVDGYPAGTRPGDFAEVRIVTERRPDAVLVPRAAVVTDKTESVVFVAIDGADGAVAAERRLVEVGFTDDEHAQILSGLVPGERVVVKGQRSLKHGAVLKILEDAAAGTGR